MKLKSAVLAVLTSAFVLTPLAKADSIIFESHTGDTYTYDLQINSRGATFLLDGFSITGLSGVTDADLTGQLANLFDPLGGVSFNSDSVSVGTFYGVTVSRNNPYSIGTLTITSAALPGVADFSIDDSNGYFVGTVTGPTDPMSPTPEPSSLLLFGTGLVAAAGAVRRKLSV
jgi:hypothetical protein